MLTGDKVKVLYRSYYKNNRGTSLAVQWLHLCLPLRGGAGSIPGCEAGIKHASWPKKQKRSNTVTNSIKTVKMVHIKKKILKEI